MTRLQSSTLSSSLLTMAEWTKTTARSLTNGQYPLHSTWHSPTQYPRSQTGWVWTTTVQSSYVQVIRSMLKLSASVGKMLPTLQSFLKHRAQRRLLQAATTTMRLATLNRPVGSKGTTAPKRLACLMKRGCTMGMVSLTTRLFTRGQCRRTMPKHTVVQRPS